MTSQNSRDVLFLKDKSPCQATATPSSWYFSFRGTDADIGGHDSSGVHETHASAAGHNSSAVEHDSSQGQAHPGSLKGKQGKYGNHKGIIHN